MPQKKVLLFHDRAYTLWDAVAATLHKQGVQTTFVTDIEQLQQTLRAERYDILLLNVEKNISPGLVDKVTSLKMVANFRHMKVYSVHANYSFAAIEEAVMLGVRGIFLHPFVVEDITAYFKKWLALPAPESDFTGLTPRQALSVQIDALGRVAKIRKQHQGNITIEANIVLQAGDEITLQSPMAIENECEHFRYRVGRVHRGDIYYRYNYKYDLVWLAEPELKERYSKWLRKQVLVFPKTKLLYIGDKPPIEFEDVLEKKLISFYFANAAELTEGDLERIWPKLVIVDTDNPQAVAKLKAWLANEQEKTVKVVTTRYISDNWQVVEQLNVPAFHEEYIRLVKPYLRDRVQEAASEALYISRHSPLSRCSISFTGALIASDKLTYKLVCPNLIDVGSIVHLSSGYSESQPANALYGKVVFTRLLDAGNYEVVVELLPVSALTIERGERFLSILESQRNPGYTDDGDTEVTKPTQLYFLQKRPFWQRRPVFIIAVILLAIALSSPLWVSKPKVESKKPVSSKVLNETFKKSFE